MGQVFTINLAGSNVNYQLLKLNQINRTVESQILLQGTTITLCRNDKGTWVQKEDKEPLVQELVQAIGNSLSLRYRV